MSGKDKHVDPQDLSVNGEAGKVSTEKLTASEYRESSATAVEESASEHPTSDISSGSFVDIPHAEIEPNQKSICYEEDCGTGNLKKPTASEYCESSKTAVEKSATENKTSDISSGVYGDVPLPEIEPNQVEICSEDIGNGSLENAAAERNGNDCNGAVSDPCEGPRSSDSPTNEESTDPSQEILYEDIPAENGEEGFTGVTYNVNIKIRDLVNILIKLRSKHYTVSKENDPEETVYSNCKSLYQRDYVCEYVDNGEGKLCSNYPVRLIVPVESKAKEGGEGTLTFNPEEYTEMVTSCRVARCRSRFVAPVILFDNKFICRSGTLSVRKTAVFETLIKTDPPKDKSIENYLEPDSQSNSSLYSRFLNLMVQSGSSAYHQLINVLNKCSSVGVNINDALQLFKGESVEEVRKVDKKIMEKLNVKFIIDLMVENRKMWWSALRITSSEKVNMAKYTSFNIEQMPFPGCEFFKEYHLAGRNPDKLVFNWEQPDCEVDPMLSEATKLCFPDNYFENYKEWDVVELSRKYLNVLLSCLIKGEGGLLVHCISGWDRTPVWISMLRVSLWADGAVHSSLSMEEMAYLTLAYDWYLFGHDLPSRIGKNEEIMHFYFNFLSRIATDEFSITKMFENLPDLDKRNRTFPAFVPGRREVLKKFSALVLDLYNQHITQPAAQ